MSSPSRLETLPIELLHHISGYLLPTHAPNRSILDTESPSPLLPLSAASKTLCSAVESYARTTLLRWTAITKFTGQMPKTKNAKTTHRGILLRWKKRNCVWCGRRTQRRAVLCTGFGCCGACDKMEWKDKITKTDAKKAYHLTEDQLFAEPGDGLPVINYGSYTVEGGVATMFLREDVERLAQAVHGDWQAHMTERKAKADARKQKIADNKTRTAQLLASADVSSDGSSDTSSSAVGAGGGSTVDVSFDGSSDVSSSVISEPVDPTIVDLTGDSPVDPMSTCAGSTMGQRRHDLHLKINRNASEE